MAPIDKKLEFKMYLFRYYHDRGWWQFEMPDQDDAQARVQKLPLAQPLGELVMKLPVPGPAHQNLAVAKTLSRYAGSSAQASRLFLSPRLLVFSCRSKLSASRRTAARLAAPLRSCWRRTSSPKVTSRLQC